LKKIVVYVLVILIVGVFAVPAQACWKCKDGKEGPMGPQGEAGYTPVKNVDYFDGADGKNYECGKSQVIVTGGLKYFLTDKVYLKGNLGRDIRRKNNLVSVQCVYEIGKNPRDKRIDKLEKELKQLRSN